MAKEQFLEQVEAAKSQLELEKVKISDEYTHFWRRPHFISVLVGSISVIGSASIFWFGVGANQSAMEDQQLHERVMYDIAIVDKHLAEGSEGGTDYLCSLWYFNQIADPAIERIRAYFELNNKQICPELRKDLVALQPNGEADGVEKDICRAKGIELTRSCEAYDKSGFHSRPNGKCDLYISAEKDAGQDYILADLRVANESYRNLPSGQIPASQAFADALQSANGQPLNKFEYTVRCTNSAGTGRTCKSVVTLAAVAYPKECAKFFN